MTEFTDAVVEEDLDFLLRTSERGSITKYSGRSAVINKFLFTFKFPLGGYWNRPGFGTNIPLNYVYEPINNSRARQLKLDIKRFFQENESRALLRGVEVVGNGPKRRYEIALYLADVNGTFSSTVNLDNKA